MIRLIKKAICLIGHRPSGKYIETFGADGRLVRIYHCQQCEARAGDEG